MKKYITNGPTVDGDVFVVRRKSSLRAGRPLDDGVLYVSYV